MIQCEQDNVPNRGLKKVLRAYRAKTKRDTSRASSIEQARREVVGAINDFCKSSRERKNLKTEGSYSANVSRTLEE